MWVGEENVIEAEQRCVDADPVKSYLAARDGDQRPVVRECGPDLVGEGSTQTFLPVSDVDGLAGGVA